MRVRAMLPDDQNLQLEGVDHDTDDQRVVVRVRSVAKSSLCPCCSHPSKRVHSRYERALTDLPWHGHHVGMKWLSRKFFCDNAECGRKIFTERLPTVAETFSRRTARLAVTLRSIVFACGGEVGARLAERLGIAVSPDTLLREARKKASPERRGSPRVIGVDDWAFCKGQRYGTLICDLESGDVLELLPDRNANSFADWLADHDGIEIVSRDRGEIYKKGADAGATNALQVADRFHLIKNLRDAFARFLEGQTSQIREAFSGLLTESERDNRNNDELLTNSCITTSQARKEANQQRREALYENVIRLHRNGVSARAIATQLGIHRSTVRRFLRTDGFPERATRQYKSSADEFRELLWSRWQAGCHNASELWKEIVAAGYKGSYWSVRRLTSRWRSDTPKLKAIRRPITSPNQVSWLLFKRPSNLTDAEISARQTILTHCEEIRAAWRLALRFIIMARKRKGKHLRRWIEQTKQANVPPHIRNFAHGLENDWDAVTAGLFWFSVNWSRS